jgi:hypothetical protein
MRIHADTDLEHCRMQIRNLLGDIEPDPNLYVVEQKHNFVQTSDFALIKKNNKMQTITVLY